MTIATNELTTGNARTMRDLFLRFALLGAFASLAAFMAQEADARGRGGGFRGGGVSMPRGSGLGRAGELQRPSGLAGQRPAIGKGQRPSGAAGAAGNTGVVGNRNGNGNGNGNTGVVNNGNVVAGNDVDVNVDNGWRGNWDGAYPTGGAYATGVAVGAATTAAVVGSYYSTLPAGCSPYVWGGGHYYSCGNSWYQPTYRNGSTVYVVVADPRQ
jgi:hypothetical protein